MMEMIDFKLFETDRWMVISDSRVTFATEKEIMNLLYYTHE